MSKKIIFLGTFIGEGVSGSHRQERIIIKCLENGISVVLIKPTGYISGVFFLKKKDDFLKLLNRKEKSEHHKTSVKSGYLISYLRFIKRFIIADLFFSGLLKSCYLITKAIITSNDSQHILLVSSPPISMAFSAYLVTRFTKKINYVVDMRDAWAFHKSFTLHKKLRQKIENKILVSSQSVITVSQYLADEFKINYGVNASVLYNVATQVEKFYPYKRNIEKDVSEIVYIGSLPEDFYDLDGFCQGVNKYLLKLEKIGKPPLINFTFIGEHYQLRKIIDKSSLLRNLFTFSPPISHEEAISKMLTAGTVFFIGYNSDLNAGVVSTKIFEYIGLGLNILPYGIRENSDLDIILKKSCGRSICINSAEEFSQLLFGIQIKQTTPLKVINTDYLNELSKNYDRFLNNLIK